MVKSRSATRTGRIPHARCLATIRRTTVAIDLRRNIARKHASQRIRRWLAISVDSLACEARMPSFAGGSAPIDHEPAVNVKSFERCQIFVDSAPAQEYPNRIECFDRWGQRKMKWIRKPPSPFSS